jgi:hypothetical protein
LTLKTDHTGLGLASRPILLRHPVQLKRGEEGEARAPCYAGAVSGWADLIAGPKAEMWQHRWDQHRRQADETFKYMGAVR